MNNPLRSSQEASSSCSNSDSTSNRNHSNNNGILELRFCGLARFCAPQKAENNPWAMIAYEKPMINSTKFTNSTQNPDGISTARRC